MVCMQVPLVFMVAFLAGRQALCIAGNLTINELLNLHKYDHLRQDDGTMYNRFDRGLLANCKQFWAAPTASWDEVYHEERLVRLHVCHTQS